MLLSTGCARRDAASWCTPGVTFDRGLVCLEQHSPQASDYRLPFRNGQETTINQGYHDYPTHHGEGGFALDFSCEPGQPILAARAGVIWETRKDSFESCLEPSCLGKDNFVVIDHGDGTRAGYHHLAPMGVTVKPGEQVCRGQLIGICGTTGYSSAPHLHWQLNALWEHSIPSTFPEFADQKGSPMAIINTTYTSENKRESTCEDTPYSTLSRSAFSHRGITLDEPLPTYFEDASPVTVQGTYHGDEPNVALHLRTREGKQWVTLCRKRSEDGRFSIRLDWAQLREQSPYYWMMMTGVGEDCQNTRWAWSYELQVDSFRDLPPTPGEPVHINRDALRRDDPRPPD